jgi:hypothetical protein
MHAVLNMGSLTRRSVAYVPKRRYLSRDGRLFGSCLASMAEVGRFTEHSPLRACLRMQRNGTRRLRADGLSAPAFRRRRGRKRGRAAWAMRAGRVRGRARAELEQGLCAACPSAHFSDGPNRSACVLGERVEDLTSDRKIGDDGAQDEASFASRATLFCSRRMSSQGEVPTGRWTSPQRAARRGFG